MDCKVSLNLVNNWQSLCDEIIFTDIAPILIQNRIITVDEYQFIVSQAEGKRVQNFLMILLKKNEDVLIKFGESLKKEYSWLAEKLLGPCVKEESKDKMDVDVGRVKVEGRDEIDATPVTRLEFPEEEPSNRISQDCFNLNTPPKSVKVNLNNSVNNKFKSSEKRKFIKTRIRNKLQPKSQFPESHVTSSTDLLKSTLNKEVTDDVITIIRRSPLVSKSWTTLAHALGLTDRVHEIRYKVILHGEDLSMCIVYLIKEWLEMSPKTATVSNLIDVLRAEGFNRVADKLTETLFIKTINVPG